VIIGKSFIKYKYNFSTNFWTEFSKFARQGLPPGYAHCDLDDRHYWSEAYSGKHSETQGDDTLDGK